MTSSTQHPPADPGEPFCRVCGYHLKNLTASTKCPECGGAIVEVLVRTGTSRSKRWQSKAKFGDIPLVSIATGPAPGQRFGHPRGIIAIGDFPVGIVAIGLVARGFVAFGTVSIGVISIGSVAIGLASMGAVAVGVYALGAIAIGAFTVGSVSMYFIKGSGAARIFLLK